jgi:hypothetical protein
MNRFIKSPIKRKRLRNKKVPVTLRHGNFFIAFCYGVEVAVGVEVLVGVAVLVGVLDAGAVVTVTVGVRVAGTLAEGL